MKPYYDHAGITIYHGDCREILPTFSPKSFDLVLTDPPYGIGENAKKVASRVKYAVPIDYGYFEWDKQPAARELIEECLRVGQECVIWGGNYFHLPPSKAWLVWDKENSGHFADCELAWTNLNQAVRLFRHMWNGMIRDSERDIKRVHPTQKPVQLMEWCLGFAPKAKTILDPFMGSGTTLVAAKQLGRRAAALSLRNAIAKYPSSVWSRSICRWSHPPKNHNKSKPFSHDYNPTDPIRTPRALGAQPRSRLVAPTGKRAAQRAGPGPCRAQGSRGSRGQARTEAHWAQNEEERAEDFGEEEGKGVTDQEREELHRFIAEKVMGWTRAKSKHEVEYYVESHEWCANYTPTTNKAQAFEVLEKCVQKTSEVRLVTFNGKWNAFGNVGYVLNAKALPEAICLFARELFK